jgi:hypothetical protein
MEQPMAWMQPLLGFGKKLNLGSLDAPKAGADKEHSIESKSVSCALNAELTRKGFLAARPSPRVMSQRV